MSLGELISCKKHLYIDICQTILLIGYYFFLFLFLALFKPAGLFKYLVYAR